MEISAERTSHSCAPEIKSGRVHRCRRRAPGWAAACACAALRPRARLRGVAGCFAAEPGERGVRRAGRGPGAGRRGLRHAGHGALRPALGLRQRRPGVSGNLRAVPASAVVRAAGWRAREGGDGVVSPGACGGSPFPGRHAGPRAGGRHPPAPRGAEPSPGPASRRDVSARAAPCGPGAAARSLPAPCAGTRGISCRPHAGRGGQTSRALRSSSRSWLNSVGSGQACLARTRLSFRAWNRGPQA